MTLLTATEVSTAKQNIVVTAMSYTAATEAARRLRQGDYRTEQRRAYEKAWELADDLEEELFKKCDVLRKMMDAANVASKKKRK